MKKIILLNLLISSLAFCQQGFPGTGSNDNNEVHITCNSINKSFNYYYGSLPHSLIQIQNSEILVRKLTNNEIVYEFNSAQSSGNVSKSFFEGVDTNIAEEFKIRVRITDESGVIYGNNINCIL